MASGTGGQLAIIRTGSLDMDISSVIVGSMGGGWRWTNFVTEGLEHNLEELEEGAITGNHDAPPSHKGTDFGEGDITFEPNPVAIGAFIFAACGQQANTLLTEAGSTGANSGNDAGKPVFQHRFTPRVNAHDTETFNEPHALMVFKDIGSAWFFNGAVETAFQIGMTAGQIITGRASFMTKGVELRARTNTQSSLVTSGGRPWVWDTVSVQLGLDDTVNSLAAFDCFESLEIDLQIPHEGIVKLNGTKDYAQFQKSDFRRVALSGTTTFRAQSEYVAFRNYEQRYLRITATNVSSKILLGNPDSAHYYTLQIDIPAFKLTSFSVPIGGPNRLTATMNGKAERPETNPTSPLIQYLLTNVVSAY